MPNVITHEILADQIKKNDWMNGIAVTAVRFVSTKSVDVTLATGKTHRWPRDRKVTIQQITPTWEETRKDLVEKLEAGVADVIKQITDAGDDSSIRRRYAKSTDMIYTIEWNIEGDLEQLHTQKLLQELEVRLQNDPTADTIVKFVESVKKRMLQWNPGRSTSAMHNLSKDAEFKAMREVASGSFGSHGISYVLWMVQTLAKHDAVKP